MLQRLITVIGFVILVSGSARAQDYGCPTGQPTAFKPGADWVPTQDCQGWVPPSHPLARKIVTPVVPPPLPSAVEARTIYARIESPNDGGTVTSIQAVSGWAVDCALGSFPPILRLLETKPDGSIREIPQNYFPEFYVARPDVQSAVRATCPAVDHVPASDGRDLGPENRFGFVIRLMTPVTEPGLHVFTAQFAWPAQNHAGSASVSVRVQ